MADHLEKGTLDLRDVGYFVLDEADEMLQMGFLEEVENIFGLLPADRQVALFSATMPSAIRQVSRKHMNAPEEVSIKGKTTTVANTRQRYVVLPDRLKADALARVLQVEDFDAALVFVRTRQNTTDVSEALNRRGFASVAISGDLSQVQREKTIADLRSGKLDVLVATDVAARGLDVERITLVVNHDLPTDPESYVHRIGRTGPRGPLRRRDLVRHPRPAPAAARDREQPRARRPRRCRCPAPTRSTPAAAPGSPSTSPPRSPGSQDGGDPLPVFEKIVGDYVAEHDVDPMTLAAALAKMVQGGKPLLVEDLPAPPARGEKRGRDDRGRDDKPGRGQGKGRTGGAVVDGRLGHRTPTASRSATTSG